MFSASQVSDSASLDRVVAILQGLGTELRSAAADCPRAGSPPALQSWAGTLDAAICELLDVRRRARYQEVLAVAGALVDVAVEGPGAPAAIGRTEDGTCRACGAGRAVEEVLERA